MSRMQFMRSIGASGRSVYSWAFVNHEERFVAVGAWDYQTDPEKALIFSTEWQFNDKGHKRGMYSEALEYMQLIENEGYGLKTFPIIHDPDFVNENGTSKMKGFVEELSDQTLQVVDGNYYAVGYHDINHSNAERPPSIAVDLTDIMNLDISETEKAVLSQARVGQGRFRKNVIEAWGNGVRCALTLMDVESVLVASHIVPWSQCASVEDRLAGANGLLLTAHIDKLFDQHLMTFKKHKTEYQAEFAPQLTAAQLRNMNLEHGMALCSSRLSLENQTKFEKYLIVHNETFYEKHHATNELFT